MGWVVTDDGEVVWDDTDPMEPTGPRPQPGHPGGPYDPRRNPGGGGVGLPNPGPGAPAPAPGPPVPTTPPAATPPAATPPAAAPPAPTHGGTGTFMDYYSWGGPQAPDLSWLKDAPTFTFDAFQAPGAQGMYADPGYQFRLDQGRQALEQSAAGKGTLRTGGSLKDLMTYGQNMASQEYSNVFNRALQGYNTNFNTAQASYNPRLLSWQNDQQARQGASNAAFNRAWDAYSWAVPNATSILNAGLT